MRLEIAENADEALFSAFQRLIPQLTNNNPPPTRRELARLLEDPATTLLLAKGEDGEIVGALTLAVYRVPTGVRSVIEDVIVDGSRRGFGIGEAMMRRGIQLAREKGAGIITLTSNPGRAAANRLYVRLGFIQRETNAYALRLGE